MRLTCPACGAAASLECWMNDATVRQVIDVVAKLPGGVAARTPAYLGLFRRGERGLSWPRALKIVVSLQALVSAGTVHWEGSEERPAPPLLWAESIDRLLAQRPEALTDHNYLRKIAWTNAKPLAVQAERDSERGRERRRIADPEPPEEPERRKRTCFACEAFRPPHGCSSGHKAIGGNQMLGCGNWSRKAAAVGDLASDILEGLHDK